MDCPIFVAHHICERADKEIEQLCDAAISRLHASQIQLGKDVVDQDENDDHEMVWFWSKNFDVLRIGRSRKKRGITFHFDMYRNVSDLSEWQHAKTALLIVAYVNSAGDFWEAEELAIDSSGYPSAKELTPAHEDARLLVYRDRPQQAWSEKAWLYAVPLLSIQNSDAIEAEIVQPLRSLLLANDAKNALRETNAVRWPPSRADELA